MTETIADSAAPAVARVTLLPRHHIDQESAYLVEDYPYGRGDWRCKIRYWVETATKGAKRGQQRMVSQTTNPARGNAVWNKPDTTSRGGYSLMVFMYLNSNGHVRPCSVTEFDLIEVAVARLHLAGVYEQMTDEDRAQYDLLCKASRHYNPTVTAKWDAKLGKVMRYIGETGNDPVPDDNGLWASPEGAVYLGRHGDPAVIAAWARVQLAAQAAQPA